MRLLIAGLLLFGFAHAGPPAAPAPAHQCRK